MVCWRLKIERKYCPTFTVFTLLYSVIVCFFEVFIQFSGNGSCAVCLRTQILHFQKNLSVTTRAHLLSIKVVQPVIIPSLYRLNVRFTCYSCYTTNGNSIWDTCANWPFIQGNTKKSIRHKKARLHNVYDWQLSMTDIYDHDWQGYCNDWNLMAVSRFKRKAHTRLIR